MLTGPQNDAGLRRRHARPRGQARHHRLHRRPPRAARPGRRLGLGRVGPVTEGLVLFDRRHRALIGVAPSGSGRRRHERRHPRAGRHRRRSTSSDRPGTDLARLAPGCPSTAPRRTDVDPRAAKRAERSGRRAVRPSAMLAHDRLRRRLRAIPVDGASTIPIIGCRRQRVEPRARRRPRRSRSCSSASAPSTGPASSCPTTRSSQQRHALGLRRRDQRRGVPQAFDAGAEERGFVKRAAASAARLLGAMALRRRCPLVVCCATSARCPAPCSADTIWSQGIRLVVDDVGTPPIQPEDIPVGGLVNAVPANLEEVEEEEGNLNARAKATDHPRPDGARTRSSRSRARTGTTRASSPTPRSAPTSAARSACTSSAPTTCSARATSRRSTSPTRAR